RSPTNAWHWSNIAPQTGSSPTRRSSDLNFLVRVEASFTDDTGQSTVADSDATSVVKDVAPVLSVSESGPAIEGSTLTASPSLTSAEEHVADVRYQWQRACHNGVDWNNIA